MTAGNDKLRIRYFSDDQVSKIHTNALDILGSMGFMVEHAEALEMLKDAGANVDFEKSIVRVKPDLVEKCMSTTLSNFVLGARDPQRNVNVETNPQFPVNRNGCLLYTSPSPRDRS